MKSFAKIVLASMLFLLSLSAFAFGNEDVIQLLKAGFGEDVVLNAISAANPATFDTSANGLIKLKNAGASSAVIQKVLARQTASNSTTNVSMGTSGGGQCPTEAPGMEDMLVVRADGKIIGLKSKQTGMSDDLDAGSTVAHFLSFGIVKAKVSGSYTISGARAQIRIADKNPEFIDLLYPPGSNLEDRIFLARMTVKGDSRSVKIVTATHNMAGNQGSSTASDENIHVPVTTEKVSNLCTWGGKQFTQYRIKPAAPLESGEYGIVVPKMIFDFGID
ncbi:MAG: hypothetical protein ACHQU0_00815 [Candidatus Paceibacteria bacterium]